MLYSIKLTETRILMLHKAINIHFNTHAELNQCFSFIDAKQLAINDYVKSDLRLMQ